MIWDKNGQYETEAHRIEGIPFGDPSEEGVLSSNIQLAADTSPEMDRWWKNWRKSTNVEDRRRKVDPFADSLKDLSNEAWKEKGLPEEERKKFDDMIDDLIKRNNERMKKIEDKDAWEGMRFYEKPKDSSKSKRWDDLNDDQRRQLYNDGYWMGGPDPARKDIKKLQELLEKEDNVRLWPSPEIKDFLDNLPDDVERIEMDDFGKDDPLNTIILRKLRKAAPLTS
jgi:hypothetical protein